MTKKFVDLDVTSMYAYSPPSPELAAQQKEDRTRKTCDVHLQRIADNRKKYYAQFGKEEPIHPPGAPEVEIVSQSGYATRYQEMLLRACLERGLKLSWDEVIHYVDILVASTEVPDVELYGNLKDAGMVVNAARDLKALMTAAIAIAIQNIEKHQGPA